MKCELRKWRLSDAKDLAAAPNNKRILNNLQNGLPFPYTEQDAKEYIIATLSADEDDTFAYALTLDDRVIGSIGLSARAISTGRRRSWVTIWRRRTGGRAS